MEIVRTETKIKGVFLQPLSIIDTPAGPVLHMLRGEYPLMPKFGRDFGEIYFSEILPGKVKAWKKHSRQTQLFAVPYGRIRLVLYDAREDSESRGTILRLIMGRPDSYYLAKIPPGIWYGFQGIAMTPSLICNCADLPHDPEESVREEEINAVIPYTWNSE